MSDRAAFEAWARSMGYSVVRNNGNYGIYTDLDTRNAWHAWQGATAAATRATAEDTARLDWLQAVKSATFLARNGNNAIAAIELFTVPSQHVNGNTVREAIDNAIDVAACRKVAE